MDFTAFLFIYSIFSLSSRNAKKARIKGHSGLLFAVLTLVSFIFFLFIGFYFEVFLNRKELNLANFNDPNKLEENVLQVSQMLSVNPLRVLTILGFSFGGFLLIRFIIDRLKDLSPPGKDLKVSEENL